jgi:hypothetical protein
MGRVPQPLLLSYRNIQSAVRFRVLNAGSAFRRLLVSLILDFGNEIGRIFTWCFLHGIFFSGPVRCIPLSIIQQRTQ